MLIEVLFVRDCPNHEPTLRLIDDVGRHLGLQVQIREIEVKDVADAERLSFLGSPSVRIDGRDIEEPVDHARPFSMSCRMYQRSGVPARALIEAAITRARGA